MEALELHLGEYVATFVDFIFDEYGTVFDAISRTLLAILLKIEDFLYLIPWWAAILFVVALGWYFARRWTLAVGLGAIMMLIVMFGLWDAAVETLAIVITSVVLAIVIGIPVGILAAEFSPVNAMVRPLLDAMQTMPSFVYLIPAMMLFGLGKVPAILATLIYAVPPVIRLTTLGISQVSQEVQEAALAFGATRWQVLKEVRLPLALPSVLAGVNQTTMMALAMVVIASMIGAGGVGEEVLFAINRIDVGRGFEAGMSVVALAIVIDRLTQATAERWKPPEA